MGEQMDDYESVWGYSIGVTEPRLPLFDYPAFDFGVTGAFTHLELGAA
jgi:lysine 2,3-aminomutase